MRITFLASVLAFACCGKSQKELEETPSIPVSGDTFAQLLALEGDIRLEVDALILPETGTTDPECDAMIPAGKQGAVGYDVDLTLFEFPEYPGKLHARPLVFGPCYEPENPDVDRRGREWSRDMGKAGLMPYALVTGDIELLQRHMAYGREHDWIMGDPLGDFRTVYWPDIKGEFYQIIKFHGGPDDPSRGWPAKYFGGLDDYEAHLQVMGVWVRATIAAFTVETLQRLDEHIAREPNCPLFKAVRGMYDGGYQPAIDVLLARKSSCEYYRANSRGMKEIEELFAIMIVKKGLEDD